jgi:VWFA-related protein
MARSHPQPLSLRALLVLAGAACVLLAQQPPVENEAAQQFYGEINVHVVNLEVFAADRSGHPVTDLTRDDFEVEVDGRQVPITNFYAEINGRERSQPATESTGRESATTAPAPTVPAHEETPVPPDRQLHIVIYVDNFNLRPVDRNRVLRALERFVYTYQRPGTQMMLVSYDHQLNITQPFTSDAREIVDGAVALEKHTGQALDRDAERRRAIDEIEQAKTPSSAVVVAESYADRLQTELKLPIEALRNLMEPLSGLPGRKALLYISNGLPKTPGEDLFYLIDEKFPRQHVRTQAMVYDMDHTYRELAQSANRAGVTFYTLDAGGLASFDSLSAASGGSARGGSYVVVDSVNKANFQAPMQSLAHDTGGFALTNSNNVELPLDQLAQDFSSYYSIGINAPSDAGMRFHKVKIDVKRRGVVLRYRKGFQYLSLLDRLGHGVTAALTLNQEVNPLDARIVFGKATPQDGESTLVAVQVQIPIGQLTLVPVEKSYLGRVRVAVQVADAEGRLSAPTWSEPLQLKIPATEVDHAKGQNMTYDVQLAMRPGDQKIAVGVVDMLSGTLSFTTTRVNVPAD